MLMYQPEEAPVRFQATTAPSSRKVPVGDDQVGVNLQLEAQAGTLGAGAVGTVEAEGAGLNFRQAGAAADAGELLGESDFLFLRPFLSWLAEDLKNPSPSRKAVSTDSDTRLISVSGRTMMRSTTSSM